MAWNPNEHAPTRDQTEYDQREIPAGIYLLGPSWMKCPTRASWKARFGVLLGPFKGASCFILQGRDISKTGTANRLHYYAQSAALDAPIDTDGSFLTEASLRANMLGRAIKAQVTKKKNHRNGNEYTDHDFVKFFPRSEWSKEELEIATAWETKFAEEREAGGGDYGGGGDWGGSTGANDFDQDAPPPDPDGDEWGDDWT